MEVFFRLLAQKSLIRYKTLFDLLKTNKHDVKSKIIDHIIQIIDRKNVAIQIM